MCFSRAGSWMARGRLQQRAGKEWGMGECASVRSAERHDLQYWQVQEGRVRSWEGLTGSRQIGHSIVFFLRGLLVLEGCLRFLSRGGAGWRGPGWLDVIARVVSDLWVSC